MPCLEVVFLGPDEQLAKVINFGPGRIPGTGLLSLGHKLLKLIEHKLAIERKFQPGEIILFEISVGIGKNAILDILEFHAYLRGGFAFELGILAVVLGGEDEVELEVDVVCVHLWEGFELHAELHEVVQRHCLVCVIDEVPEYLMTTTFERKNMSSTMD